MCALVGELADLVDDRWPEGAGEVVAHPWVGDELGAGDRGCGGASGLGAHQGVLVSVDDERGNVELCELFAAVSGGDHGGALAGVVGFVSGLRS